MDRKHCFVARALASSLVLAGCGGGGGIDEARAPAPANKAANGADMLDDAIAVLDAATQADRPIRHLGVILHARLAPSATSTADEATVLSAHFLDVDETVATLAIRRLRTELVARADGHCELAGRIGGVELADRQNVDVAHARETAGEALVVTNEAGTFAKLVRDPDSDDPFSYTANGIDGITGALGASATMAIPGDTFPALLAVPVAAIEAAIDVVADGYRSFSVGESLTWTPGNDGASALVDFAVIDEESDTLAWIDCTVPDSGTFRLPAAIVARLPTTVDTLYVEQSVERERLELIVRGETLIYSSAYAFSVGAGDGTRNGARQETAKRIRSSPFISSLRGIGNVEQASADG